MVTCSAACRSEVTTRSAPDSAAPSVITVNVVTEGPADKAGLRPLDLLISANGEAVTNAQSLQRLMLGNAIGQPLALTVLRSEALVDVIATPEELRTDG